MYRLHSFFSENFDSSGARYSVDKVVIKGTLNFGAVDILFKYLHKLNMSLCSKNFDCLPFGELTLTDFRYTENNRCFLYQHCFNFIFSNPKDSSDTASFWFACVFWDNYGKSDKWKLEFNPNKVGDLEEFKSFYRVLYSCSKRLSIELAEFDIAVDYPIDRPDFCLIRTGRRSYHQIRKSFYDFTEYLGTRHKNGYVKLYNKQIESNLSFPLTRLEVTLTELSYDNFCKQFPNIRLIPDKFTLFDKLSDDDRLVLYAILLYGDLVSLIHSNETKRRWLRKLDLLSPPLEADRKCFNRCVDYLLSLMRLSE